MQSDAEIATPALGSKPGISFDSLGSRLSRAG